MLSFKQSWIWTIDFLVSALSCYSHCFILREEIKARLSSLFLVMNQRKRLETWLLLSIIYFWLLNYVFCCFFLKTKISSEKKATPKIVNKLKLTLTLGDPWVAQRFSAYLWLRAWSWGPGMEHHLRLPRGSLLLPLPVFLPQSVCLSWINKILKNKSQTLNWLNHPGTLISCISIHKQCTIWKNISLMIQ